VSLEQFKKQVLLLHSEQSTLDNLSTGFSDRYTVHCATSGSEALNTLGQTEIDVIVTAQKLPGMSGLDALREARKRSPDTIGILLAGDESDGIEAMVGEQEVFQIVRGEITPAALKNLIDGVTRQSRLLALAESANDTTANVDEPAGEHIVMETSENGSTIISDGTGLLPILDPKKVSAAADIGSREVDVLVLTQDEEFLTTVKESARGLHNVIYANTLEQAEDFVRKNKVGVAVVDAAMVGTNAETVAMQLRSTAPRLVAIVAGRRDDGELKPVSPGRSRLAIEASVKHHLEAPDSAFIVPGSAPVKAKAQAAPKPQPQPKPQPMPEVKKPSLQKPAPAPKAEKPPEPKPTPKAAKPTEPKSVKAQPAPKPATAIVPKKEESLSPIDAGLADAFDRIHSSFTETMTGIVASIRKSISAIRKSTSEKKSAPEAAPAFANSGGSIFGNPKVLGIGAGALVAIAGLSFWMFSGSDEQAVVEEPVLGTPSITEMDPVFEAAAPVEIDTEIDAELDVAIEQALGMAESAILERRIDDAAAALQRVAQARPENSRLKFLSAQLDQMKLRNYLDDARLGIRESRFEDARIALDGARSVTSADAPEIDAVEGELSTALSDQRVDDVLEKANARLQENLLIAPSNDNARFYYELALSNDPGNTAARQGLTIVANKLVLQARTQIDAQNFDEADALLADVRRLDPSSSELATTTAALQTARDRLEQERAAAEQRAADERAAAVAEPVQEPLREETAAETSAPPEPEVQTIEATEPVDVSTSDEDSAIANAVTSQQSEAVFTEDAPIPVSSLQRTKYVAPRYPRSAQRRDISGWVDVVLTVGIDGSVTDVSVRGSNPGDTFVASATKAVEGWKFAPVIENGVAIQKRAAVRMMFALE